MLQRMADSTIPPDDAVHGALPAAAMPIVEAIYRAGAGLAPWRQPLDDIARLLDLWVVQFFGVDKRLGSILFSHEGGRSSPETAFDYFHEYHRIDPRAALVVGSAPGTWLDCNDHFDERYVAASPFYQQFLLPHGGRHVYGAKIAEDEEHFLVLSFLRGKGSAQLDPEEKEIARTFGWHVERGFRMQQEVARLNTSRGLGLAVLEQMRQPLMVLDSNRALVFSNASAKALIARRDLICERDGYAVCADADSDVDLMFALRELALGVAGSSSRGAPLRSGVRLRRASDGRTVAATLLALRPDLVMGAFGNEPLAMLVVYEPASAESLDPFLLSATFGLTPAEARVAARLVSGLAIKQIAKESGVSVSTVRSQMKAIFEKTGTHRQADLVRILLLADEF